MSMEPFHDRMAETVSTLTKVTRGRANLDNYRVMRWLEEETRQRGLSLREVGRRMGHANATRVREYFNQKIVPGPAVLGNLAAAIGVSPIEVLWNAGRQDFVFRYFHALFELGWWWMHKDHVGLDATAGARFFRHYSSSPRPKRRGRPAITDVSDVPPPLHDRYHAVAVYNEAGVFRNVALPKPMACAILLAIGLFPRRGDRVRPETPKFLEDLGPAAFGYILATERTRVPPGLKSIEGSLTAAGEGFRLRYYARDQRFAIVGEYVHGWTNVVCRAYADYARVALYQQGAFVGEASEYEDLWAWQTTPFPNVNDLTMKDGASSSWRT